MQIIPLTSDGARRVSLNLSDGSPLVTFRTYYNYRAGLWFLDLIDADDLPILTGLALAPGIDILRAHPVEAALIGELRVADLSSDGVIGPESLGETAFLVQYDAGEFIPAAAPNPGPLVSLDNVLA